MQVLFECLNIQARFKPAWEHCSFLITIIRLQAKNTVQDLTQPAFPKNTAMKKIN